MYRIGGNFYQEKVSPILPPAIIGEIFIFANFLSCVNDYIEDMATFTVLAKIYSTKYFCNTKVSGLGKILSSENFHLYSIVWN